MPLSFPSAAAAVRWRRAAERLVLSPAACVHVPSSLAAGVCGWGCRFLGWLVGVFPSFCSWLLSAAWRLGLRPAGVDPPPFSTRSLPPWPPCRVVAAAAAAVPASVRRRPARRPMASAAAPTAWPAWSGCASSCTRALTRRRAPRQRRRSCRSHRRRGLCPSACGYWTTLVYVFFWGGGGARGMGVGGRGGVGVVLAGEGLWDVRWNRGGGTV